MVFKLWELSPERRGLQKTRSSLSIEIVKLDCSTSLIKRQSVCVYQLMLQRACRAKNWYFRVKKIIF